MLNEDQVVVVEAVQSFPNVVGCQGWLMEGEQLSEHDSSGFCCCLQMDEWWV